MKNVVHGVLVVLATACSGGAEENADANLDANLTTDMNMDMNMDMNAGMDMNMINGADGMNATENAMVNDMTTNDADTNLANGM